jgi:hypothetical protein
MLDKYLRHHDIPALLQTTGIFSCVKRGMPQHAVFIFSTDDKHLKDKWFGGFHSYKFLKYVEVDDAYICSCDSQIKPIIGRSNGCYDITQISDQFINKAMTEINDDPNFKKYKCLLCLKQAKLGITVYRGSWISGGNVCMHVGFPIKFHNNVWIIDQNKIDLMPLSSSAKWIPPLVIRFKY